MAYGLKASSCHPLTFYYCLFRVICLWKESNEMERKKISQNLTKLIVLFENTYTEDDIVGTNKRSFIYSPLKMLAEELWETYKLLHDFVSSTVNIRINKNKQVKKESITIATPQLSFLGNEFIQFDYSGIFLFLSVH